MAAQLFALDSVEGWVSMAVVLAGVVLAGQRWVVKLPLEREISDHTKRITDLESDAKTDKADVERLRRETDRIAAEHEDLRERFGEVKGALTAVLNSNTELRLTLTAHINDKFHETNERIHGVEMQFSGLQGQLSERLRQERILEDLRDQLRNRNDR